MFEASHRLASREMAETKLSSFKDQKWSLHGMTALVTGGTRDIGFVQFNNVFYSLILTLISVIAR